MSRLIVQKYGGSSLADAERIRHVAGRIARDRRAGADLVVVVSAMGDTTDHLLDLAAAITDDPDPREMDLLLATGEHISGTLVAMALHAEGIEAISLTGPQAGIRTDTSHGRARIATIEPARLRAEIERGRVVIVAGFQGSTDSTFATGEVTTLGRGGSDTTAVALAARLRADACEIYTDVEGIFTADPRVVTDAQLIPVIGYEEMLELAHQGAQVMQTRAVELGWVNEVIIRVRSTFSDHPGTSIQEVSAVELRDKVRAMALDRKVAKVTLIGVPDRPGIARAIFGPMADQGLNVDMIVQNVGHDGSTDLSFTVDRTQLARAERLLELLSKDLGFAGIATDAAVAKISIVGEGIHNSPGYAAQMFGALADEGINISMISTSEIRITCIIAEDQLDAAARAVHRTFRLAGARDAGRLSRLRMAGSRADGAHVPRHRPPGALHPGRLHAGRRARLAGRRPGGDLPRRRRRADGRSGPPGAPLAGAAGTCAPGLGRLSAPGPAAGAGLAAAGRDRHGHAGRGHGPAGPPGAERLALKWPNDIVAVREGRLRKVGGVLAETEAGRRAPGQRGRGPGRQRRLAGDGLPARAGGHDEQPSRGRPRPLSIARPCCRAGWRAWRRSTVSSWPAASMAGDGRTRR